MQKARTQSCIPNLPTLRATRRRRFTPVIQRVGLWGYIDLGGHAWQNQSLPKHCRESIKHLATPDNMAESIVCGPDPEKVLEKIKEYVDAGFTHIYLHQVGPDQQGFFDFAKCEILSKYGK